jgi:excisionase family DNA binding protein
MNAQAITNERVCLTIEEARRLLGIGRSQAYAAARSGELPTVRIGKRLLVPRIALERMLERAGDAR